MKVLLIGGNGNISWWCAEEAIRRGDEVYELNRGMTRATRREVQPEVHEIIADIRNEEAAVKALSGIHFDVVCDFICFNDAQARQAIEVFQSFTRRLFTNERADICRFVKIRRNMRRMWRIPI